MNFSARTAATLLALSLQTGWAGPVQWSSGAGGNDHYYEFVNTSTACNRPNGYDCLDWHQALDAAAARTYLGTQGYLASVTTFEEMAFIIGNSGKGNLRAWIAGSDEGDDGNFTWRAGPETGVSFLHATYSPEQISCLQTWCDDGAFALRYVRDSSDANYLMIGIGFEWQINTVDDHFPGVPSSGFGRPVGGYLVEYGGDTPEPSTFALITVGAILSAARLRHRRGAEEPEALKTGCVHARRPPESSTRART